MAPTILCVSTDHDLAEANMLCALHNQGFQIIVVIDPSSKFIELFQQHEIKVHPRHIEGKVDIGSIRFLRKLIKEEQVDIVHTFSKKALCAANLSSILLPVKVIGYRGIVGNLSRFDPSSWLSFLHPKVKKVVCVCRAVENSLRSMPIRKDVPITIYKGHKTQWYDSQPAGDLSQFGIDDSAQVICCTANLRPRKGISVLIESLQYIPDELNVHLLLIGKIGKGVKIEEGKFGARIHCAGFREDAVSLMRACDLFVMPSLRREGLPKAVIEAMSVGTVPIVTTSGGMPEIVVDGECGRVIPPGDAKKLAGCIVELLENTELRQEYSTKAVQRINEHFNLSDTVASYDVLYRNLSAGK